MSDTAANACAGLPLLVATPPGWAAIAVQDLDGLLEDHAHCEMKAAATGFRLLGSYPERGLLVDAMLGLVREEMRHFERVREFLTARGRALGKPLPDRSAGPLSRALAARPTSEPKLIDRLIICALIEARSCERFRLLATAPGLDPTLAAFYEELGAAEARHHEVFLALAETYARTPIKARLREAGEVEAAIVQALPPRASIH